MSIADLKIDKPRGVPELEVRAHCISPVRVKSTDLNWSKTRHLLLNLSVQPYKTSENGGAPQTDGTVLFRVRRPRNLPCLLRAI